MLLHNNVHTHRSVAGNISLEDVSPRFRRVTVSLCLLLTLGVGQIWAADATLTITRSSFTSTPTSYNTVSWSQATTNGTTINGTSTTCFTSGNSDFQMKNGHPAVSNSTAMPGAIKSITFTRSSNGSNRSVTIYVGTEQLTESNLSTKGTSLGSKSVTTSGVTWTLNAAQISAGYTYFYMVGSSNALYVSSIVVTYDGSTEGGDCNIIDVTGGSAVILPNGSTTVGSNTWENAGAPTTYPTSATEYAIGSNGYCVNLTQVADYGNSNGLQFKASSGVLLLEGITSNNGIDVEIQISSGSGFSIELTGATTLTGQSSGTKTISTTSTSANLTISKTSSGAGYIKYIKITPKAVSCSEPTGLNNGSVTSNSATLSVTSAAANYQFYYSTSSTAPTSSTSPTATVSSAQSKNITGLSYGTTYYYWARHDCGGSSYSDWVAGSENTFTTTAPAPTSVAAGSITMSGATLTISDSYSPASYDIYYSTSSTAPTSGTTATATSTTKSKELTGLTSGQTYYYWVRGVGNDAKSSWVAGDPTTFTTVSLNSIAVQTAPTKTVYLAGETFDPTGLVITRYYSNSTSDTYSYAGHTGDFTFSPGTSTSLTKSHTSVTITYGGKTASQSITVYNITLNVKDDAGNAIRSGGPSAPTRSGWTLTPAADADNYKWWKWEIDGATLGSAATTKSNTITSPTGDVTVTAVYYAPRTVTWMVNKESWTPGSGGGGGTNGTAEVARGTKWNALILPSDPTTSDGCGDKFIGWTSSEISGKLDKDDDAAAITTLYNNLLTSDNKSSKTTAINNNIVFHAVFADYAE